MKKFRFFAVILFIVSAFCGCMPMQAIEAPLCRVTTKIVVKRLDGITRTYTQDDKMEIILDYLRLAEPCGPAEEDPETADGFSYLITIYSSDGQQKSYRQKADCYLCPEGGHWQLIRQEHGQRLNELLLTIPGD